MTETVLKMAKWKVRMYQEGDEEGIIKFMNLVWPQFEHTMEHWLWKYKNNPFGFLLIVADCKNEIVGQMGSLLVDLKIGDTIMKGSQRVDLAVHPKFRRQGVTETMEKFMRVRAAEEDMPISYAFPNEPSYYFGVIKMGWFDICKVPELILFLNTYNVIKRKYERLGKVKLISYFSKIVDSLISAKTIKDSGAPIRERLKTYDVSAFDDHVDEFWKRVSASFNVGVVRSSKYLNWRYFMRPNADYKAFLVKDDNQIEGYIILSVRKLEYGKEGYILDALASTQSICRQLLHLAIEYFSRREVDIIKCWMLKDHFWHKILKENGFIPNFFNPRQQTRLVAQIYSPKLLEFYKNASKKWYITYGDWDVP